MATASELLAVYRLARQAVYQAADGLSQQDAVWKPTEHVKSIQELLVHVGGSERFWLSKLGYDVLDYPEDNALEHTLAFLHEMKELVTSYVTAATPEQFNAPVSTDRGPLTLAWVLKRVTQHMFYHLSTLVYLRRVREPSWDGEAGLSYWQKAVDAFSELIPPENLS
ncbi:MAG: DinB family protein [Candidatus Bipolaricaulia bacterium]